MWNTFLIKILCNSRLYSIKQFPGDMVRSNQIGDVVLESVNLAFRVNAYIQDQVLYMQGKYI